MRSAGLAPFGFFWAFALLYHQVAYAAFLASPFDIALTLAALVTLVFPASPRALAALSVYHILAVLHALPSVTNHWYFGGLVSGALLIACLGDWWSGRKNKAVLDGQGILDRFAPAGRLSVALVYGLSGFHKLNADFFTPGVSCATELTERAARFVGVAAVMPDPGMLVVWLTVIVELGLPVLLLVPRTRLAGIVVAIGFHVVMALAGYPRFSATGVALLSLFLPGEVFRPWFRWTAERLAATALGLRIGVAVGLFLSAITSSTWAGRVFLAMQLLLTALLLAAVVRAWARSWALPRVMHPGPESPWRQPALLVPAFLVAIAAQPYLGLPTDRALGMYSNLRTEGGATNHFVIPSSWQLFPYQRDVVIVETASAPELQRLAEQGLMVPFQELRARLTEVLRRSPDDISLTYQRGGRVYRVQSVRADAELDVPITRLQMMVFRFRPVEVSGPRACTL
ncbi:MAG: HTTM domain-containing protein [Gemmatimonadales bacterium]